MEFLNLIKESIPDYAKDIRLNIDGTIARSSLEGSDAVAVALAAAFAAKSQPIIAIIKAINFPSSCSFISCISYLVIISPGVSLHPAKKMSTSPCLQGQFF